MPPSQIDLNVPVISIARYGGEGEGESVVIQLIMETIYPSRNGVDGERDMVRGGGTEITNSRDGGEEATEEE